MSEEREPRKFLIGKIVARNNKGDGVHIGSVNVEIQEIEAGGNAGNGVHISDESEKLQDNEDRPTDRWYEKPIGALGLTVAGGLVLAAALWALKHYFAP